MGSHVDSLDSKASIVLGFTALVLGVAVTRPEGPTPGFLKTGIGLGGLSFLLAIASFWVRPFFSLPNPRRFYEEFAGGSPEQTRIVLCNLAADAFEQNRPALERKARFLKMSLVLLVGAMSSVVIGFYVEGMI